MSVCYNKTRKKYFICYDLKLPDGTFKTFSIYNKEWTKERGKKYVQMIEQDEIDKDQKTRKLLMHKNNSITVGELFEMYKTEVQLQVAEQTAYAKIIGLEKYFISIVPINMQSDLVFTIKTIEDYKRNIVSKNLTSKRTNDILRFLKEFLMFVSDRDYISYDLARKLCNLLKPISTDKEVKEKLKFWTVEEWNKFYASFDNNDPWRLLFEVEYMAALRIGELIGLQWKDFDRDKKTILIRQSITNSGKARKTKNKSSNATVTLPEQLVQKLVKFKEIDMKAEDNDFIFFANKRTSKTSVRRVLNKHIQMSGVPQISPHGLRHSCASRMINMGISPLIVSKHLRHSSVKETLDTYSHIFPNEIVGIIDKVFK